MPFRSIDPDDVDFSDLEPLKKIIGEARVVQLGEQSHGDGACFETKIRLIKFLHQEMGFDVLAFESGLYDCRRAWQTFQSGDDPLTAAEQGVFGIWTGSAQTAPLWKYLSQQANTERPLELVGFDCQFTARASREHLYNDLCQLAERVEVDVSETERKQFESQLNLLIDSDESKGDLTIFFDVIERIQKKLEQNLHESPLSVDESRFWKQELASLLHHCRPVAADDVVAVNHRDAQMARNLLWIANEAYPDKKIIVWAASFHITRNLSRIKVPGGKINYDKTVPTGHHVHDALGEQLFTIGFTAFDGNAGPWFRGSFAVSPAPEGTLEGVCRAAGLENGLIPFRSNGASADWLQQPFFARPLGYTWMEATWPDHFDAMIFNQTMTPSTR